jgi:diguanylate cyclase (GGDEF)-like protein
MAARILIADDSMVVRAVIKKPLLAEGHHVHEVGSGDAVLEACRSTPPDVVLLDVEMPGMTGHEVLQAMQDEPALATIPVIFLSGRVSADDVALGLRLGAHDYLRKPVEPGELVARVTAALRTKALHDRLRAGPETTIELTSNGPWDDVLDVDTLGQRLRQVCERARLDGLPVSAVLLDIDGLDAVNRTFTEAVGDGVIRRVVEVSRGRLRGLDLLGRCGPDELLAVLPETPLVGALAVARDIRSMLSGEPMILDGQVVDATVSAAAASTDTADPEALLRALQDGIVAEKARRDVDALQRIAESAPEPKSSRWRFGHRQSF